MNSSRWLVGRVAGKVEKLRARNVPAIKTTAPIALHAGPWVRRLAAVRKRRKSNHEDLSSSSTEIKVVLKTDSMMLPQPLVQLTEYSGLAKGNRTLGDSFVLASVLSVLRQESAKYTNSASCPCVGATYDGAVTI